MVNKVARKAMTFASAVAMLAGCAKGGGSFSTLADSADFKQEAVYVPKKIDILWVIDNSGSMASSQANLASNFQSFISRFNQFNYDFHMAVVTTDGWEKQFNANSVKAKIRDGNTTHSGVFVMDKNTPNLSSVFDINAKVGVNGNGDERAFESLYQSLSNEPTNDALGFRRSDAFLAVIIVSDEDDFSNSTTGLIEDYNSASVYPVSKYTNFLDSYTGGLAAGRNYSVNTISIQDTACLNQLNTGAQKVAQRYAAISDATGGVKASICSNFGTSLSLISDSIIQLSSAFKLTREPIPETIVVSVDGVVVPQDATNGWTYDVATMILTFHGSAVPGANTSVKINFDPKSIQL
ncbi:vWA domain-containing protein [Bdellovibrio svalbardensis]|uniref:VWFA domain-containing protein n=1 Tax=Bdellovibrio svalbardensis TaxID=2972972 RepID=A0ABT6DQV9_9BACT|nr:hypothetical protein [Bdellovibrio svalbardensis]MDG0817548.1 hypothetical protein [Bdellovibrio svalbardensis]